MLPRPVTNLIEHIYRGMTDDLVDYLLFPWQKTRFETSLKQGNMSLLDLSNEMTQRIITGRAIVGYNKLISFFGLRIIICISASQHFPADVLALVTTECR